MRLQPRQQLLDIWRAVARQSFEAGEWRWGGRDGRGSISDAEQLLCIMYPASMLPSFRLDRPDAISEDVLVALRTLGGPIDIPRRLIQVLTEYMTTYQDGAGTPVFSGGPYFAAEGGKNATDEQRALDVVDSFSMSVSLALATLGFVRVFRAQLTRPELQAEADALERLASNRLTAAMVGLLRSFAVNVFDAYSPSGLALLRTVNRGAEPNGKLSKQLQSALVEIRAGLRDLTIGSGQVDFDNPDMLFECGWSWGVIKDAPQVATGHEDLGCQPAGYADERPYLYFTAVALDGIADLFNERTRVLGLLNDDQLALANALQRRWTLTRTYWADIASFGQSNEWPLEDIPWRTSDHDESDYYSLLVTSLVAWDLERRRAGDSDLARLHRVLEELAGRGRVTRRAMRNDSAVELHMPGVALALEGSERLGPPLEWVPSDFAVILLKRTVMIAQQARSAQLRASLLDLADEVWNHLEQRRLDGGSGGSLWDDPVTIFQRVTLDGIGQAAGVRAQGASNLDRPSWYFTERVVEALVMTALLVDSQPLHSDTLFEHAAQLLAEAEQLFDQEQLSGSMDSGPSMQGNLKLIRANLRRARQLMSQRPGTAAALTIQVLRDLDRLDAARSDSDEMS